MVITLKNITTKVFQLKNNMYIVTHIRNKTNIVQQSMSHDKPYFSNISDVYMLILMANYYTLL